MVILAPSVLTIKEIHDFFIRQYGVSGYMCEGMVEGCLERAMTYVFEFKPFPKLYLKAAAILYSFITFHPFVDANKRTAFETTRVFLRLNGYQVRVKADEGVAFTKAIADLKVVEIDEIAEWIKKHSRRTFGYTVNSLMLKSIFNQYQRQSIPHQAVSKQLILLMSAIVAYPD